ncbi:DUF637 domain-containing protein, partial [Pseudomonas mosselii]|uniref:DUF637 domain-containing protein n=1 Tax=Pseudomonas mosselii TaxID=78327 RepID=UPI001645B3DF
ARVSFWLAYMHLLLMLCPNTKFLTPSVKEIHESFKYSHSGLGAAPSLLIAIVAAAYLGPLTGALASNLATGTINNGGDIGQGVKFAFNKDNLKSYAIAAAAAYVITPQLDKAFGVSTDNINKITKGFDLGSVSGIAQFGLYSTTQGVLQAGLETAVKGGSFGENLKANLVAQTGNVGMAIGFDMIGGWALGKYPDGSPQKVMAHALFGGLVAKATGSDFASGAVAAGANEALSNALSDMVGGDENLELMAAQVAGLLAVVAIDGDFAKGAEIAKYATAYNQQVHRQAKERLERGLKELRAQGKYIDLDVEVVLTELRRIADGKATKVADLDPKVAKFLGTEFSPASMRETLFEPEDWEQYVGFAIDLLFPSPAGKAAAVERVAPKISKEALAALEAKFGADLLSGGAKGSATALQNFGGRTANDLAAAAVEPINKEGLTKAARALTKHASGQRTTGTFPKLTGGIENQNAVAKKIVDEIVSNPNAVYTNLSRGGLEIRVPDGRGMRYNSDGSFSTFLDPKL